MLTEAATAAGTTDNDEDCRQLSGRSVDQRSTILHLEAVPDYRRHNICGVHVVILTKLAVTLTLPYYLFVLAFIFHHGNATTFMFGLIILGSVAAFSIYGAFKGSKMCLVPFIFMQVVLIVYSIVLAVICLAGAFSKQQEVDFLSGQHLFPMEESKGALLLLSFLLLVSVAPLFLSTHIVYRNFIFISELDDALEWIASRRQSNPSKSGF